MEKGNLGVEWRLTPKLLMVNVLTAQQTVSWFQFTKQYLDVSRVVLT